jgi:hypothetical protein
MKHHLCQFRLFRKLYGGNWYLVRNDIVSAFWTQDKTQANSCGGRIIDIERH